MGELRDRIEDLVISAREWAATVRVVTTAERARDIGRMVALGIQKEEWQQPDAQVIPFPTTYEGPVGTAEKTPSGTLD